MLGILVASIGMDTLSGAPRFEFGSMYLLGGVPFTPFIIGCVGFAQVIKLINEREADDAAGLDTAAGERFVNQRDVAGIDAYGSEVMLCRFTAKTQNIVRDCIGLEDGVIDVGCKVHNKILPLFFLPVGIFPMQFYSPLLSFPFIFVCLFCFLYYKALIVVSVASCDICLNSAV